MNSHDEPDDICANCQYWQGDLDGRTICINTRSRYMGDAMTAYAGCDKFFPDPKRWPEADHD